MSMEHWQKGVDRNKKLSCPSATLSTIKLKWTDIGSNPGLRGEKPATNRFSHGTSWNNTTKTAKARRGMALQKQAWHFFE